jgi:leucyl-tRNA synthetase
MQADDRQAVANLGRAADGNGQCVGSFPRAAARDRGDLRQAAGSIRPHVAEELWSKLGYDGTLAYAPWPKFDPELALDESQEYVVQVNGKVRHRFRGENGLDASALMAAAKAEPQVSALLEGRYVTEIAIPGRLVNFVVRE